ncbi:stage V sporulation protein AB [Anaerolentibacter hominis]|uniref:stage V sporulation protein AB n=1 Tax=Anaerolentibacter hominis TaxID=3079009 RepID=UPI0031B81164
MFKNLLLGVVGLAAGTAVSAGVFSFITMIGIIPRLAAKTKTANRGMLYEDMIILGGTIGNIVSIFQFKVPIGIPGLICYGFFSGVFVGCLAVALAEVLRVIPVLITRVKLRYGLPMVLISIAIGKMLGSIYQLIINP